MSAVLAHKAISVVLDLVNSTYQCLNCRIYQYDCIFLHFNVNVSDVRMAGYSLSSLENHLDSLGASYVDGVRVRINPRYTSTPLSC